MHELHTSIHITAVSEKGFFFQTTLPKFGIVISIVNNRKKPDEDLRNCKAKPDVLHYLSTQKEYLIYLCAVWQIKRWHSSFYAL